MNATEMCGLGCDALRSMRAEEGLVHLDRERRLHLEVDEEGTTRQSSASSWLSVAGRWGKGWGEITRSTSLDDDPTTWLLDALAGLRPLVRSRGRVLSGPLVLPGSQREEGDDVVTVVDRWQEPLEAALSTDPSRIRRFGLQFEQREAWLSTLAGEHRVLSRRRCFLSVGVVVSPQAVWTMTIPVSESADRAVVGKITGQALKNAALRQAPDQSFDGCDNALLTGYATAQLVTHLLWIGRRGDVIRTGRPLSEHFRDLLPHRSALPDMYPDMAWVPPGEDFFTGGGEKSPISQWFLALTGLSSEGIRAESFTGSGEKSPNAPRFSALAGLRFERTRTDIFDTTLHITFMEDIVGSGAELKVIAVGGYEGGDVGRFPLIFETRTVELALQSEARRGPILTGVCFGDLELHTPTLRVEIRHVG